MFIQADRAIFSATDLINYLGCRHATFLNLANLRQPMIEAEPDPTQELLKKKGLEHERRHLASLRDQGKRVVMIDPYSTLEQRVEQTTTAMVEGADVIYQGALLDIPWMGYADFLLRVHSETRLGPYGYEVVDTKLGRTAQPKYVVQLCVYSRLLGLVQGQLPENIHVVLGDSSQVSLTLTQFLHYAELAQGRLQHFAANPPEQSFGVPCGHCAYCHWIELCSAEWDRVDHLSLVANITRHQITKLEDVGIKSVRKLSELANSAVIPKMPIDTLSRLRQQAQLQISKRDTGKDSWELRAAPPGKGFARMPEPDAGDLFFDMEGDPLADDGLEYLFGFAYRDDDEYKFKSLWAHSHTEEKQAFEHAIDFMIERLAKFPNAHIYHYASYEQSAVKRLSVLHGTREDQIDDLLRRRKLVDLYKVVREAIRISEPHYSLKNIETFYMLARTDEVNAAGDSIVVYEQWRELRDPALLKQIEDYNATDCRSTLLLRDWLLSLRPKETPWFVGVADQDEKAARSTTLAETETRRQNTTARLLDGVSAEERPYRELISQLLEFYRREAKPLWWARYNWQDSSEDELIDDPECIGGLRAIPGRRPIPDKQSLIHTFRFPPQDYKLREGDLPQIAESFARAGEIVDLDDEQFTVSLRIGKNAAPFPTAFSLIPGQPIKTDVLREAIYRYAEAVIAGRSRYAAINSLSTRQPPAVEGVTPGNPIIDEQITLERAVAAIGELKNSYVLIQGPPGAGKTFTAAHSIVELLRQGNRVGVSSNSHKAINTLLAEVETVADRQNVKFRGVKKGSDDDHCFDGKLIENVTENHDVVDGDYDLIAGTAWLFAREELDQALDYLFVDEAGQVSLANVVAMGVSARNLVLIGDQMQLAQPTQGVHPGDSGLSALEYALGDLATVPAHLGIFLDKTRRMHPEVCRFVSDAFYDSRLQPDHSNARQSLLLGSSADIALAPTGIRFVDVEHSGCSQSSEAEAAILNRVFCNLLKQRWLNAKGGEAPIGISDILVVSPYNMQVDLLRRTLPTGARVGTVDKFQGQEAAIVLISMATSSSEDMPRNIEFLFSRNRLNVAISRARCLAVIFASPRLLETPCSSIDQMRLVNALCWAKAYAGTRMS